jgi:hypothetical protein
MSAIDHAVENSTGTQTASIEANRFERAVTEPMSVERMADRLYRVTTESGEYDVDLRAGACSCPDAEYRGDRYVCKHAVRAVLVEVFANTVSTELVARVVAFARDQGCPVEGHGGDCTGLFGGTGALPCPTCCDAARSPTTDEYDVWNRVVAPRRATGARHGRRHSAGRNGQTR